MRVLGCPNLYVRVRRGARKKVEKRGKGKGEREKIKYKPITRETEKSEEIRTTLDSPVGTTVPSHDPPSSHLHTIILFYLHISNIFFKKQ